MKLNWTDTIPGDARRGDDSLWWLAQAWLRFVLNHLLAWHERRRQRLQLLDLDDRMLKDIGLTRRDVEAESRKPFWRE